MTLDILKKKSDLHEEIARQEALRGIRHLIGGLLFAALIGWFYLANFTTAESCVSSWVSGKYGEGRRAVQAFKNDCRHLTKENVVEQVANTSKHVSPAETYDLIQDILKYW